MADAQMAGSESLFVNWTISTQLKKKDPHVILCFLMTHLGRLYCMQPSDFLQVQGHVAFGCQAVVDTNSAALCYLNRECDFHKNFQPTCHCLLLQYKQYCQTINRKLGPRNCLQLLSKNVVTLKTSYDEKYYIWCRNGKQWHIKQTLGWCFKKVLCSNGNETSQEVWMRTSRSRTPL